MLSLSAIYGFCYKALALLTLSLVFYLYKWYNENIPLEKL